MAHAVETMAWAREVPWHGLGTEVPEDLNADEFLVKAGLDWEVNLHPLYAKIGDEEVKVDSRYALIRSSDRQVMTVASERWKPLQNREVLDFFQRYVTAGGARLETAGSLWDGRMVWGLARLGHSFETRPGSGDRTEGYLLFTSPHEVGKAIKVRTTTVRVVCANTFAIADRGAAEYSQSHVRAFDFEKAREAVAASHEALSQAEARWRQLDALKLGMEDAVRKVLVPVFAPHALEDEAMMRDIMLPEVMPRTAMEVLYSCLEAPGATPGTGWGVLNGVTHWADHVAGASNRDRRMVRAWTGDTAAKKLATEAKLLELAA